MSQDNLTIQINPDQRTFVTGKTGSGKTFLVKRLIRPLSRVVVLDSKGTLDKWGLEEWDRDSRKKLGSGEDVRVRVAIEPGRDPARFWEDVLEEVYNAANVMLYIDEASQIAQGANPSPWLNSVWTRGREFGVGAIAASQRPRQIPRILISEAEHVLIFRLNLQGDRDYMAEMVGETGRVWPWEDPDEAEVRSTREALPYDEPHGFWYMNMASDAPIYVPGLPARVEKDETEVVELEFEEAEI